MSGLIWIKLYLNIFDNIKVRELMKEQKGREVVLLFLILLVEAGKTNKGGKLYITGNSPHTVEALELISGMDKAFIEEGLLILKKNRMISISKKGVINVVGFLKYQDPKKYEAKKEKTKIRQTNWYENKVKSDEKLNKKEEKIDANLTLKKQKPNANLTPIYIEEEIEKEIEVEVEKDDNDDKKESSSSSSSNFTLGGKVIELSKKSNELEEIVSQKGKILKALRESSFQKISENLVNRLLNDCTTYGEEWVVEAIYESDLRGIRSYAYVKKILENWKSKGKWKEEDKASTTNPTKRENEMYDFGAEMGESYGN